MAFYEDFLTIILLILGFFDLLLGCLTVFVVTRFSPPSFKLYRRFQINITLTITTFDVVTALFGPIFINSLSGVYLIGFFRLNTHGTYIFMIFFYVLMCLQSGALVVAFTAKLYALLPIIYRKKLKIFGLLYIGSFYGLIPIGVSFLFYVYSSEIEKYSQIMLSRSPDEIPALWQASVLIVNPLWDFWPFFILLGLYQFGGVIVMMVFQMLAITYLLNVPQPFLSRKTIQMQAHTFRVLALQFLTDVITFGLPYISYVLAQAILLVFEWSWVATVEKYAIPCLSILSNTHSGISSLVVLTTSRPYISAVSSILRFKCADAKRKKITSYVYNGKVFFARNKKEENPAEQIEKE